MFAYRRAASAFRDALRRLHETPRGALLRLPGQPEPAAGPGPQKRARGEITTTSERKERPEGKGPKAKSPKAKSQGLAGLAPVVGRLAPASPGTPESRGVVGTTPLGEPLASGKRGSAAVDDKREASQERARGQGKARGHVLDRKWGQLVAWARDT